MNFRGRGSIRVPSYTEHGADMTIHEAAFGMLEFKYSCLVQVESVIGKLTEASQGYSGVGPDPIDQCGRHLAMGC